MENFSDRSITLAPSDDLNYSKYWVNPCIGAEVLRGKKLRAQKLKSEQVAREYDVVDIDFDKPSCSTKRFQSRSATVMKKKKRHKSPLRASTRLKNQRTHNKCPIRIAELAVPTKRLCIETWRNKGETLPSFMVCK
ncbi:jg5011 [Pararge aegeria aegeria]|uniref:Jg5011 protein n=1 Tax=Pararge aegeria aegeria TaxID=348720 RepID=A0A8S4R0V2_9NEOP|nr:jg5011 [Pararge aegeria aegeria]